MALLQAVPDPVATEIAKIFGFAGLGGGGFLWAARQLMALVGDARRRRSQMDERISLDLPGPPGVTLEQIYNMEHRLLERMEKDRDALVEDNRNAILAGFAELERSVAATVTDAVAWQRTQPRDPGPTPKRKPRRG